MQQIIINLPDGSSAAYELTLPTVTVGSSMENVIIVPHESVAMEHLRITLDVSGYIIEDLAGGGATALNDYPIEPGTPYQLEDGMRIRMGETEAVYSAPQAVVEEVEDELVEEEPEQEVLAAPGSFPKPTHPAGVFVPKKAHLSLWMVTSLGLAALVLIGTALLLLQVSGVLGDTL
jgi:pSer/pThr/pTyr-binding forkhead associated (FHA) protein